jgi:fused signal recognition particle receptor
MKITTVAFIIGVLSLCVIAAVAIIRTRARTSSRPIVASPVTPEAVESTTDVVSAAPKIVPTAQAKGFGKSHGSLTGAFRNLFARNIIDDDAWQDLADTLIMADMGVRATSEVVAKLQSAVRKQGISDVDQLLALARAELTQIVDAGLDRTLHTSRHDESPAVVLTVGVNGTGKTTTTGKIAKLLAGQDKEVLLGAADTFRAAAADQLVTWGDRVGAAVIRGAEGSDPASVAFEAVAAGYDQQVDVVLIDTAGRLHTKQGLMDELGKLYRVASKRGPIAEVLLVIDATTGQNGLTQAKIFSEVVPVTGVVLSKLDGTAKGGIVIAVQQELGVPVKLVGIGEGPDDLAVFDPAEFVSSLLA